MKYRPSRAVAVLLGQYAAANLNLPEPGEDLLVVPMPASPKFRKERGFNQSEVIANEIAEHHYNRPLLPKEKSALKLKPNAKPQTSLGKRARLKNRRNAFIVDRSLLPGASVLLVDDVISTGATATGATIALLQAGAKEVIFACLAKNPGPLD